MIVKAVKKSLKLRVCKYVQIQRQERVYILLQKDLLKNWRLMRKFLILLISILCGINLCFAVEDVFNHLSTSKAIAQQMPKLGDAYCKFTQEKRIGETVLKSGGNFQFIKIKVRFLKHYTRLGLLYLIHLLKTNKLMTLLLLFQIKIILIQIRISICTIKKLTAY